ncbi:hypothetical protein WISP_110105 [Willisornis vidua]|uniref:Uncharacterized protein n=1 Tax=Willisornis vidua TaxID=1566151 RepID=A0ABQ9CVV6_9PASS|nr:hypothetical protein WISP_110105 [Willisornis vidua]
MVPIKCREVNQFELCSSSTKLRMSSHLPVHMISIPIAAKFSVILNKSSFLALALLLDQGMSRRNMGHGGQDAAEHRQDQKGKSMFSKGKESSSKSRDFCLPGFERQIAVAHFIAALSNSFLSGTPKPFQLLPIFIFKINGKHINVIVSSKAVIRNRLKSSAISSRAFSPPEEQCDEQSRNQLLTVGDENFE